MTFQCVCNGLNLQMNSGTSTRQEPTRAAVVNGHSNEGRVNWAFVRVEIIIRMNSIMSPNSICCAKYVNAGY